MGYWVATRIHPFNFKLKLNLDTTSDWIPTSSDRYFITLRNSGKQQKVMTPHLEIELKLFSPNPFPGAQAFSIVVW